MEQKLLPFDEPLPESTPIPVAERRLVVRNPDGSFREAVQAEVECTQLYESAVAGLPVGQKGRYKLYLDTYPKEKEAAAKELHRMYMHDELINLSQQLMRLVGSQITQETLRFAKAIRRTAPINPSESPQYSDRYWEAEAI